MPASAEGNEDEMTLAQTVVADSRLSLLFNGENDMKKLITSLMSLSLVLLPMISASDWAADPEKDADRLKNSDTVLKEILDVPDDIPQDLLDKADCVVVFPSVLKAAFIVGGSQGILGGTYHDGSGGRQLWLPNRWRGNRLCTAGNERAGCERNSQQQGEAWSRCVGCRGPCRPHCLGRNRRHPACGHLELFPRPRRVCRCRTRGINHSS